MNKTNLYVGMGMGIAAVGGIAMLMKPKKSRRVKVAMGKALKAVGEVADTISDTMGW